MNEATLSLKLPVPNMAEKGGRGDDSVSVSTNTRPGKLSLPTLRKAVEWYFTFENLRKDAGNLKAEMDSEKTVSLATIVALEKVSALTTDEEIVDKALEDSDVVVCEEGRVKAIWNYSKKGDKCIQYPKASLKFRLQLPAPIKGYIKVRTIVFDDTTKEDVSIDVGTTDTCDKSSTPVWDRKPIDFTYYCGVDNHQKLVFDIYDGDYLGTSDGYLLESKEIMAVDIFRPITTFPISIERDKNWGQFTVDVSYDAT